MQGIFKQLASFTQPPGPGAQPTRQDAAPADPHNIINTAISAKLPGTKQPQQDPHCEHAFNLVNTLYRQHQGELQREHANMPTELQQEPCLSIHPTEQPFNAVPTTTHTGQYSEMQSTAENNSPAEDPNTRMQLPPKRRSGAVADIYTDRPAAAALLGPSTIADTHTDRQTAALLSPPVVAGSPLVGGFARDDEQVDSVPDTPLLDALTAVQKDETAAAAITGITLGTDGMGTVSVSLNRA